jgi:hypothetical protein
MTCMGKSFTGCGVVTLPRLLGWWELVMVARNRDQTPAVGFDQLDRLPAAHRSPDAQKVRIRRAGYKGESPREARQITMVTGQGRAPCRARLPERRADLIDERWTV